MRDDNGRESPSMSDKAEAKKPGGEGEGEKAKAGPIWTKLPVLLGGVMLFEAVLLIGAVKILGGGSPRSATAEVELVKPEAAKGEEGKGEEKSGHGATEEKSSHGEEKGKEAKAEGGEGKHGEAEGDHAGVVKKPSELTELEVTALRAPNVKTGRRYLYDLAVFASVKEANRSKLERVLKERKATVEDRIRTIVAECDPDKLGGGSEPGLETLRRQIKYQIQEIAGDDIVVEVLIPRCIPFRAD